MQQFNEKINPKLEFTLNSQGKSIKIVIKIIALEKYLENFQN